ncbi:MAG: iron ABC transporter permease, partial [Anaerolineae bacterium]|nr:iron ABC transporter permease [Anaerolineae bacterium]
MERWNPAGLRGRWSFFLLAALVALLVALPIGSLLGELLDPATEVWMQLWTTTLPRMLINTLLLMAGVACGTLLLGIGLAWLVTAYQFPLRGLFDKALLLPL